MLARKLAAQARGQNGGSICHARAPAEQGQRAGFITTPPAALKFRFPSVAEEKCGGATAALTSTPSSAGAEGKPIVPAARFTDVASAASAR